MKDFYFIIKSVFFLSTGLIFGAAFFVYLQFSYVTSDETTVLFAKGTSVRKIGEDLENSKVIRNKYFFEAYLRFTKKNKNVRSGEYLFTPGMRLEDVVQKITTGDVIRYQFTIPEGYNLRQIREVVVDKFKIMSGEKYDALVKRVDWLRGEESKMATSLEGFLFPDTYFYEKTSSPDEVIQQMVKQFYLKITPALREKINKSEYNLYQIVTLASVVEKETGLASERPLIASVFFNRLAKGMMLQSDPTVIYGVENFDGNLTRTHLQTDTPYNTYTRTGLPKGPICSVGIDAILAVLNPDQSEFFYFVGKGDGSHFFSKTLDKHNEAVRYYQLKSGTVPEPE